MTEYAIVAESESGAPYYYKDGSGDQTQWVGCLRDDYHRFSSEATALAAIKDNNLDGIFKQRTVKPIAVGKPIPVAYFLQGDVL